METSANRNDRDVPRRSVVVKGTVGASAPWILAGIIVAYLWGVNEPPATPPNPIPGCAQVTVYEGGSGRWSSCDQAIETEAQLIETRGM